MRKGATMHLVFMLLAVRPSGAQVSSLVDVPVTDSVRAELTAVLEEYYDAFSDRDWERFQQQFWPGATITFLWAAPAESKPSVRVQSLAEFVAAAPAGPGSREVFEERMIATDIRVRGAIAAVFTRYQARFGDLGDIAEWEGVDSFLLMKNDGQWRIVALAFEPGL